MKKYILMLFISLMYACSSEWREDNAQVVNQLDGIKNESGADVEISFYAEDSLSAIIKKGDFFFYIDSSRSMNVPSYNCGLFLDGCQSKPIDVYIKFMSDPAKCISYTGDIQKEKIDIRSIEAYQQTDEYETVGAKIQTYQYVISVEMFQQAELCN